MSSRVSEKALFWSLLAILSIFVIIPLFLLVVCSVTDDPFRPSVLSAHNYVDFFAEPKRVAAIINTLVISAGSMLLAVTLGLVTAWTINKTEVPLKRLWGVVLITPYFFPPFLGAMSWALLANPFNGILNNAWSFLFNSPGPFNVYSHLGIMFVLGIYFTPTAFLMISGPMGSIDRDLEEQSAIAGSTPLRVFRRITLPLVAPSLISTAVFVFVLSSEQMTTPLFLGTPAYIQTLSTLIFRDIFTFSPPKYGLAVTSSIILMTISLIGINVYYRAIRLEKKYVTITGRGFRSKPISLGKWKYLLSAFLITIFMLTVGLPIPIIVLASLQRYWIGAIQSLTLYNYQNLFARPIFLTGVYNTLILTVITSALVLIVGILVAYFSLRTKITGRNLIDYVANIPLAIPGTVFSLGMLLTWVVYIPTRLAGTLTLLGIAYFTRNVPLGVRALSNGFLQISPELEEISKTSGASPTRTTLRVTLPLLRENILSATILTFVTVFRDIGSVLFLYTGSTIVLPMLALLYWEDGSHADAATVAVLMCLFMLVAVILLRVIVPRMLSGKPRASQMR